MWNRKRFLSSPPRPIFANECQLRTHFARCINPSSGIGRDSEELPQHFKRTLLPLVISISCRDRKWKWKSWRQSRMSPCFKVGISDGDHSIASISQVLCTLFRSMAGWKNRANIRGNRNVLGTMTTCSCDNGEWNPQGVLGLSNDLCVRKTCLQPRNSTNGTAMRLSGDAPVEGWKLDSFVGFSCGVGTVLPSIWCQFRTSYASILTRESLIF